jgi:choline dehydrogenase-like flavoprotein
VHSVIYDPKTNRATGVRVIDAETMETREFHAKVVFLCASTLGSTQVLLNSTSEAFPTGLGNSSGVLGHYLMDHLFGRRRPGRVEGYENDYYSGPSSHRAVYSALPQRAGTASRFPARLCAVGRRLA